MKIVGYRYQIQNKTARFIDVRLMRGAKVTIEKLLASIYVIQFQSELAQISNPILQMTRKVLQERV